MSYRRLLTALLAAVIAPIATAAVYAQLGLSRARVRSRGPRIWVGGDRGFGRIRREPAKWAERANFDGELQLLPRLLHRATARKTAAWAGGPTIPAPTTTSPSASAELTFVRRQDEAGRPARLRRRCGSPIRCSTAARCSTWKTSAPIRFSDEEVESLRDYLLKGGFLYVDDFWGTHGVGAVGRTRSAACCRRTSIRSSTSRAITRSCTRCTT